jgi:hypothetical protein
VTSRAIVEALRTLHPRTASIVLDIYPNGLAYITVNGDKLWVHDGGGISEYLSKEGILAPDPETAQALAAEHNCGWRDDPESGPWVVRNLDLDESPAVAVDELAAAIESIIAATRVAAEDRA